MKKLSTTAIVFLLCFCTFNSMAHNNFELNKSDNNLILKNNKSRGDDEGVKGKFIITPGIGFNILGTSMAVRYGLSNFYGGTDGISGKSSPMFNVGVDYGILQQLSVGVGFGFQTAKVTITDAGSGGYNSNYYNYYGYGYGYVDTWTRIHMSARADYHIISKEKISLYTGVKLGFNIYSMKSTIGNTYGITEEEYKTYLDVHPTPISIQAHFGFNYYFTNIIGFNVEAGIGYGGPYLVTAGVSFKL